METKVEKKAQKRKSAQKNKQKRGITNIIKIIKISIKQIISELSNDIIITLTKILEDKRKETKYDELYSEIRITNDYSKFSFFESNRNVKLQHIKKLVALFKNKLLDVPVKVDEHFRLLDGQHTIIARMMLNKPILYYISKNIKEEDIPMLNSNSKSWAWDDFLHSFIKRGNKHYIKYKELWDEYNGDKKNKKPGRYNYKTLINHNEMSLLIMGYTSFTARVKDKFYGGELEFKNSEVKVREILDFIYNKILGILDFDLIAKRDFQSAFFFMYSHKNFDKSKYLKMLYKNRNIYNSFNFKDTSQGRMKYRLIDDYNAYVKYKKFQLK